MAFSRLFHGMLRFVTCGAPTAEDESCDEEVAIEIDVDSADVESVPEQPQLPQRMDSLEVGFQVVMNRAWTFAHKWSQPERRQELLAASRILTDDADSDSDLQGNCVLPASPLLAPLEVDRDSSQARFEQLMHRTSRFYQRCSMLQQHPDLLLH